MRLDLQCQPDTPCDADIRIGVEATRCSGNKLTLRYFVEGEVGPLVAQLVDEPIRRDGLWKTTCLESFVTAKRGGPYHEFNFSPSRAWAAYSFDAYRHGMRDACVTPVIEALGEVDTLFVLTATIDLAALDDLPDDQPWYLGLSAVIEEISGRKSYWALAHPPGEPDFHHPDCFIVDLPPPEPT